MSLLPFFQWCENTAVGDAIRSSLWLFPVIEGFHLLGLALIGGAVLVLDLRLLGLALRRQPVARIARDAQPWLIGSLLVMASTGILLFLSESTKCYYSQAFWVKMTSLFLAIVFTFTVRRKVAVTDETRVRPIWCKLVAVVSLTLWLGVGAGGRWIGFSG
jgi:hypothetical protein